MNAQQQCFVTIDRLVSGRNPRRFFDEGEMRELEASIRANGVMQPLLVRPAQDGRFEIIAGERRWRAARTVHGDTAEIPVLIRDVGDEEADILALVENSIRADMAASEEAEAAHRLLTRLKGDREEAAAMLGWTVAKLNRRVALMRLTDKVRGALTQRSIQLGHAELLAALPPEQQDGVLEKITGHGITVTQVKAQLARMACALSGAIFDKTECGACPYSSSSQHALFSETIDEGFCTRPGCYQEKTEQHLKTIAESLKDEVPRVEIVRPGDATETIRLQAEGNLGVGEKQAAACAACADFGCTISAVPGALGEIERSICFNAQCHASKVAANLKAKATAYAAGTKPKTQARSGGTGAVQAEHDGVGAEGRGKAAPKSAAASSLSQRVKDYRLATWRKIAAKVMFADPHKSRCVLVALAHKGMASHIDSGKVGEAMRRFAGKDGGGLSLREGASAAHNAGEDALAALVTTLAPSAMRSCPEHETKAILGFLGVDMGEQWSLDEELLKLLTKSEIEALAAELGIADAMGKQAMNRARAGKRDDLIKAVLGVASFTYQGAVPAFMRYAAEQDGLADDTLVEGSTDDCECDEAADAGLDELEETADHAA